MRNISNVIHLLQRCKDSGKLPRETEAEIDQAVEYLKRKLWLDQLKGWALAAKILREIVSDP